MTYPTNSRVKYRDVLDGPTGLVLAYSYNEEVEEWEYSIAWSDLPGQWSHSAHFIHSELEVY